MEFWKIYFFAASAVFGFEFVEVDSISIEGQLMVIRNDCYERIAIGEKLDPKKVYKKFDYNTVALCETECTKEKETCRAYSVGIGAKGNGTCELGKDPVKETIDLKPIGTIKDPDYDLYIKKLDCQVIIEKPTFHGSHSSHSQHDHHQQQPEETYLAYSQYEPSSSQVVEGFKPENDLRPDAASYHRKPNLKPSEGYHYDAPNTNPDVPDDQKGDTHHVQTLVSIASGPNSQLHPVHGILVAGSTYYGLGGSEYTENNVQNFYGNGYGNQQNYGYGQNDRPFGGQNYEQANGQYYGQSSGENYVHEENYGHKYSDMSNFQYKRPQTNVYGRPNGYEMRPPLLTQDSGYDSQGHHSEYFQIDRRKYDSFNQHQYGEESHRFGEWPPRRYRPEVSYNNYYDRPLEQAPTRYGSVIPHPNEYGYLFGYNIDGSPQPSTTTDRGATKPETPPHGANSEKKPEDSTGSEEAQKDSGQNQPIGVPESGDYKPIVTQTTGSNGQHITSIITELRDDKACFRRTLAGKRVVRGLVRKYMTCETAEQCQRECAEEKRFTCEGFNYRLDPTGRGKGDCEILDLPLSRIDVIHEVIVDPDYDYYSRDRNAAIANCRQRPDHNYLPYGNYGHGGSYGGGHNGPPNYDYDDYRHALPTRPYAPPLRRPVPYLPDGPRPNDRWGDNSYGVHRPQVDRRHDYGRPVDDRRGDYSFHHSHASHRDYESSHSYHYNYHNSDRHDYQQQNNRYSGIHYLPASHQVPTRLYEPYIPPTRYPYAGIYPDRDKERWGSYLGSYGYSEGYADHKSRYGNENRRNHYLPRKPEIPSDWGLYGGTYGNGGILEYKGYADKQNYDYWGFNKYQGSRYDSKAPPQSYLPPKPAVTQVALPGPVVYELDNFIVPIESKRPAGYDFLKDECSLRTATGFRLHKRIVRKFFVVPNIYECELLCFKEKQFVCSSYAFRYTVSLTTPTDNCFLSDRNYKELDFYVDLEPDRDFDIYTMNNKARCQESLILGRHESDCFWRVRSGQRLDHAVVRDSLIAKSVVDCQLECLKSKRFTCRAYSFRYTSPIIGGIIDNCQLTDWPFVELDSRLHFVAEPGFEIYERGSFGHGCEPDHFGIGGRHRKVGVKIDQLCYIGFGSAARLLPQATRKSVYVPTELDCKQECSKSRDGTLFRCMTFSYRTGGPHLAPNCYLSDIVQRDLLPNVDYVGDKDSWLFTWDNYNPECTEIISKAYYNGVSDRRKIDETYGLDFINALDTWRVYSVSGWPCRRGSLCKENLEAGFWFCELEGGDKSAWDYCCRPDHQCGVSNGYPYEWCYVGPARSQWRKCSDSYYPYGHNVIDRNYLPKPNNRPQFRPDRPAASPLTPPIQPTLDEYETQFDDQFLSPPKPGGLGLPRRWPVSYLHKEMPPNNTESDPRTTRKSKAEKNSKITAIKSLIDVIKTNDFSNVQYHIANNSDKPDDVLYVKIPLPTIGIDKRQNKTTKNGGDEKFSTESQSAVRTQKSLATKNTTASSNSFRRGFVTRTNITQARKYNFEPY
ncbi:uncharacterized protein LOC132696335 [Cylas formicarius]|uniref:uncharacterized protein LOC132696335 n=1 Tax=Cylas formicarius TaxID=197179 RepID=UPI0029589449|nr:uncharacterized protein LOC132696335 [Cylas formicarius]